MLEENFLFLKVVFIKSNKIDFHEASCLLFLIFQGIVKEIL